MPLWDKTTLNCSKNNTPCAQVVRAVASWTLSASRQRHIQSSTTIKSTSHSPLSLNHHSSLCRVRLVELPTLAFKIPQTEILLLTTPGLRYPIWRSGRMAATNGTAAFVSTNRGIRKMIIIRLQSESESAVCPEMLASRFRFSSPLLWDSA